MTQKVIIVGAGIVGLSSAYFLNKKGFDVTVVDETDGRQNCSTGNAGFFCPSHVIPLAAPGIITQGFKWMLNDKSPFYVKPTLSKDLISWGWKFKKAATRSKVAKAAPLLNELTHKSQALVEQIIEEEKITGTGYIKSGLLMLCQSEQELAHEKAAAALARSFGQVVEILSPEEASKLNPGLEANIVGAVYYPNDSMLTPHIFLGQLRNKLEERGVKFLLNTRVASLAGSGNKITHLTTGSGSLEADEFMLATGSRTSKITAPLGLKLPMQGGKGYSFSIKLPYLAPRVPAILADGKVSMSPMMDGLRFSGTMELNGHEPAINPRRIEGIIDTVTSFFPQISREDFKDIKPWAGFRPCTPDGLPYLGKPSKYSNLTINAGHAMLGVTLGPISGQIAANIISGLPVKTDISLLAVDRYV